MRTIIYILRKEFLQILRNRSMIPLIFFMPLFQLLILSHAVTYEIRNIKFEVVDLDNSRFSRDLISKFSSSGYFQLQGYDFSADRAVEKFKENNFKMILNIPKDFEKNFRLGEKSKVQLLINAEDGMTAGVIMNYSVNIIKDFNGSVLVETGAISPDGGSMPVNIEYANWYNPELNYKTYMVPGILVILVSIIGMFLTGMNIAREKEIGTIEQLNVTPIKKYQFIIGKLFPFWIIGIIELLAGIVLGIILYDIPMLGNPLWIFISASLYLFAVLGIGLFVSTVTHTQQQAMFIAWFIMVLFILMGGIFTPIENMPDWAQFITKFIPTAYFNRALRMIMLKGSGFKDLLSIFYSLAAFAAVILSLAIWRYRKVS